MTQTTTPADPIKTGPTYLNPSQLADLIGVNRSTISRWAATDPSMPVIRIHGVVRFRLDQVELWLAGQTQGASRAQRRARAS
jgi:phage terminase Nu1 subunit (DNA packaging protein)